MKILHSIIKLDKNFNKGCVIMVTLLYCEVNAFAIFVLAILLYNVVTGIDKQNHQYLFVNVLASQILFYILDILWACAQSGYFNISKDLNFIISALYFIASGLCGYSWFVYSENLQKSKLVNENRFKIFNLIPFIALTILTVTSYKTHWLIYIDDNNIYHRGKLYVLQIILSFGYVIFTTIKAFLKSLDKKNYIYKHQYLSISSFVIIPLIFCILQAFIKDIPLLCVGITLAMINVYIRSQSQLISIDPLTQLNNRNQLIKYLSNKIKYSEKSLYLLIMDLDYFKKINDKFGHIEGDKALVCVSNTLKFVFNKKNMFIARYGGDEFIVICEDLEAYEVDNLCVTVNKQLAKANANKDYVLKLSIGYAKYNDADLTIQDFINLADEQLYMVKKSRKNY